MTGTLLVCGTASDAGKSLVVAGLCRWLRDQGRSVAPFKAQNMALNSAVTPGGAEIGRAQVMQAAAAGVEPEAAMNPVLIKPSGVARSQVLLMGEPFADATATSYQALKPQLRGPVLAALDDLRARFDVVVCEGAGSPAEINLRANDIANMGLARAADVPVLLVGDIDRGGVFPSLFGTVALLEPEDQALVAGFVINKFRGDPAVLAPGLEMLDGLTGRPTFGVLPWLDGPFVDAEDSLALRTPPPARGPDALEVAVIRLRWMSNFTDVDALAAEPGVHVRYTRSVADVERADLVLVPGTKATVEDLERLRADGLDAALTRRARRGDPILGVCGGYQLLGERIHDDVESGAGEVTGLGLLPVTTTFEREKLRRRVTGTLAGDRVSGYEIRHGHPVRHGGTALLHRDDPAIGAATTGDAARPARRDTGGDVTEPGRREPGGDAVGPMRRDTGGEPAGPTRRHIGGDAARTGLPGEGCVLGAVIGTSWHGLLEGDAARRTLLSRVAAARGREWVPGETPFAAVREAQLDRLGAWIGEHLDTDALLQLIETGAPAGLPTLPPGGPTCSVS